jgi:hypothetical protein
MVSEETDPAATIARLEERVAALERVVADRSRLLRQVTRVVCDEDAINISRLAAGQPPIPRAGFGLRGWRETTSTAMGDVDRTMAELWRAAALPVLD